MGIVAAGNNRIIARITIVLQTSTKINYCRKLDSGLIIENLVMGKGLFFEHFGTIHSHPYLVILFILTIE